MLAHNAATPVSTFLTPDNCFDQFTQDPVSSLASSQDESTQPGQNNNSPTTPDNNDDSQTMTNAEKYMESIVQLWSI